VRHRLLIRRAVIKFIGALPRSGPRIKRPPRNAVSGRYTIVRDADDARDASLFFKKETNRVAGDSAFSFVHARRKFAGVISREGDPLLSRDTDRRRIARRNRTPRFCGNLYLSFIIREAFADCAGWCFIIRPCLVLILPLILRGNTPLQYLRNQILLEVN